MLSPCHWEAQLRAAVACCASSMPGAIPRTGPGTGRFSLPGSSSSTWSTASGPKPDVKVSCRRKLSDHRDRCALPRRRESPLLRRRRSGVAVGDRLPGRPGRPLRGAVQPRRRPVATPPAAGAPGCRVGARNNSRISASVGRSAEETRAKSGSAARRSPRNSAMHTPTTSPGADLRARAGGQRASHRSRRSCVGRPARTVSVCNQWESVPGPGSASGAAGTG